MKKRTFVVTAISLLIMIIASFIYTAHSRTAATKHKGKSYELIGDGMTDNNMAFSSLITDAPANSKITLESGKQYVITQPVILTKPITVDLRGSTIIGKGSAAVFRIQSDNVTIQNGVIDLNYTTHNGITARGCSNIALTNLNIKDLLPTATNSEGGVYLQSCTDIVVNQCTFKNIFNGSNPDPVDHSPAIKFISCKNCTVKDLNTDNCGVGVNIYGTQNVSIDNFNLLNTQNNGFYIQTSSQNINIQNGKINGAENGLTFKLTNYTPDILTTMAVTCTGVDFSHVTNKAISLRTGSGLKVSKCNFSDNKVDIAQSSSFAGCSNIIFIDNTLNNVPF